MKSRTYQRGASLPETAIVMAVLLAFPLPDFIRDLRGPLFAAALACAVAFCFVFFWGCVWVSTAIGRFLGTTSPVALLSIGALAQLTFTVASSTATWYASHLLTVQRVLVDAVDQTGAFIVAYLIYRALKPPGEQALASPTPNNRWRGP